MVLSAFLLCASILSSNVLAALHETWIHEGAPSPQQIADWSAREGSRSYLLLIDDPAAHELENLSRLRNADRLQIETRRYPAEHSVEGFKAIKNVELVTLDAGLPTEYEAQILNRIAFKAQTFVVTAFPGIDARPLHQLKSPTTLTFATKFYPRFVDKQGFLEVPAHMPFVFATDYWPWYTHMDVMNLLPNAKRLRVKDMFPPADALPYLHGLTNLESVTVDTDYDAPNGYEDWRAFGKIPVRWSNRGRVPSEQGLKDFVRSAAEGERKLVIDMDRELTDEEKTRLLLAPIEVEHIRQVF